MQARRWARWLAAAAVAVAMALVSFATLSASPAVTARWGVSMAAVDFGRLAPLLPAPLLGAAGLALVIFTAGHGPRTAPYLGAAAEFLSGYAGLASSIAPYVAPYAVTLWQAAARDNPLALLLVGVVVLSPLILSYTATSIGCSVAKPRPSTATEPPAPLRRRLAWFAGLWLAGLGTTAAIAYGLRALPPG